MQDGKGRCFCHAVEVDRVESSVPVPSCISQLPSFLLCWPLCCNVLVCACTRGQQSTGCFGSPGSYYALLQPLLHVISTSSPCPQRPTVLQVGCKPVHLHAHNLAAVSHFLPLFQLHTIQPPTQFPKHHFNPHQTHLSRGFQPC
jgi:hypothetical protein